MPELVWQCTNPDCLASFGEYVNGCPCCATGEPGGSWKVERIELISEDW